MVIHRANLTGVDQPGRTDDVPQRMRRPMTDDDLRALARRYDSGASMRALVSDTGRAYGTIHRALHTAAERGFLSSGIRPKGGARVHPSARPSS
ncbi:MAG: helix-turn-helix domain-containing protein [Actinoplanes sp.]